MEIPIKYAVSFYPTESVLLSVFPLAEELLKGFFDGTPGPFWSALGQDRSSNTKHQKEVVKPFCRLLATRGSFNRQRHKIYTSALVYLGELVHTTTHQYINIYLYAFNLNFRSSSWTSWPTDDDSHSYTHVFRTGTTAITRSEHYNCIYLVDS